MVTADDSHEKLTTSIPLATNVLALMVALSVKRGFFGALKPSDYQIGWSYGFVDAYAQSIDLKNDEEFILFISFVFEHVFGKAGLRYFRRVASNMKHHTLAVVDGGTAHNRWMRNGDAPLMPTL